MENNDSLRLQKFLSVAGVCSRRKAEEYMEEGRIEVNGETITSPGFKVKPGDEVKLDGKVVKLKNKMVYIMLHKPEGYVTTLSDEQGRPTVLSLIKDVKERVYPVGRLDYNTSGLLILTNDGELTNRLTHPRHNIYKTYMVRIKGAPSPSDLKSLQNGIIIDGRRTAPAKVFIVKQDENYTSLKIMIREGRNRQIRKMCEAAGYTVMGLKRIATGKIYLGELPKGEYRHLTKSEIAYLRSL